MIYHQVDIFSHLKMDPIDQRITALDFYMMLISQIPEDKHMKLLDFIHMYIGRVFTLRDAYTKLIYMTRDGY